MTLAPQPWSWTQAARPSFSPLAPGVPAVVWCAKLPPTPGSLTAFLSPEELTRLARIRQPADQHRFLAGRGLLRELLGAHLHQPPASLVFHIGPSGKPFISLPAGAVPLHFNVSHSGDFVLVALSETREVGVDIEQTKPLPDLPELAARILSPGDLHAWRSLPPSAQLTAFYSAWTRHEARLKALGHGFAESPGSSSLTALTCIDLQLPAGYAGALALAPFPLSPARRPLP